MQYVASQRGKNKLCFQGYMYNHHRQLNYGIRWRCIKRYNFDCKATAQTNGDVFKLTNSHNHEPHQNEIEVVVLREKMKNAANSIDSHPSKIFSSVIADADSNLYCSLPSEDICKRTIRNQRAKNYPKDPETLDALDITGSWTTTGGPNPERLLLHDTKDNFESRIIVFASEKSLQNLSEASTYMMDGTFSVAPRNFLQMYVLRVPIGEIAVTAVYALMEKKTQAAYEKLFQAKISDFGLSRALRSGSEYYKASTGGRWPVKCDVWSYGVTLWEIYSYGEPPYGDMNGTQVIQLIEANQRLNIPENCLEKIKNIIQRCWQYIPAKRPTFRHLYVRYCTDLEYASVWDHIKHLKG